MFKVSKFIGISHPYRTVNVILAGFILGIFLYSAIFSPDSRYPLNSDYERITGEKALSSGLSRGFSSIIRLNFDDAIHYNPYSIRIFSFFLLQFFLRIIFTRASVKDPFGDQRYLVIPDVIISGTLFLVFFEPFWREMIDGLFRRDIIV